MEFLPSILLIEDFKKSDQENYDWTDEETMGLMWWILENKDNEYGLEFKVIKSKVKNLEGYHERKLIADIKRLSDSKVFKVNMYDSGNIGVDFIIDEIMNEKFND